MMRVTFREAASGEIVGENRPISLDTPILGFASILEKRGMTAEIESVTVQSNGDKCVHGNEPCRDDSCSHDCHCT